MAHFGLGFFSEIAKRYATYRFVIKVNQQNTEITRFDIAMLRLFIALQKQTKWIKRFFTVKKIPIWENMKIKLNFRLSTCFQI